MPASEKVPYQPPVGAVKIWARVARSLTTDVFELILAQIMREHTRTLTPTLSLGEGEGDFDTLAPGEGETR